ncbi:MAG: 30S ribosomal protein S9 [Proteobacteria bacterium]|nr:30S ribosomal protein S9 [Pseudomonadota bacterium]
MTHRTVHGRAYGTGRRKTAIARVFLRPGSGQIIVNGRSVEEYFRRETSRMIIVQPFESIDKSNGFDVVCTVRGGGLGGQAEAVRNGISRALLGVDPEHRGPLKKSGFLTRDSRKKERKKPGQPGARKKFQYSKR